ncbi:MAG: zinc-ribbon domain-containing protein [Bacteroidetes bacterium]|nr:zinc-ribbon domain-containing protein [Bacteroidota bacterium]MCB0846859.1 zinc-ribbon domain-containing protein [Bacteroidota bacterium]
MIIYGSSGAKNLKVHKHHGVICPHCGHNGSLETATYTQYAHIYWIPLFSLGKRSKTTCANCQAEISKGNRTLDVENVITSMKSDTKIPFWHFTGLAIIAGLIAFGSYESSQNDKNNQIYITDPQIGDVYEIKVEGNYSLMKVLNVRDDSVEVIFNDYETNKRSKLDEIDVASRYTTATSVFSRERIQELFEEKFILDVNRD